MKKKLTLILLLFGIGLFNKTFATDTTRVKNVSELLEVVASDRIIELQAGTYNLSNIDIHQAPSMKVSKQEFNNQEPVFDAVNNLQLIGRGTVKIIMDTRTAWVMIFENSANITLKNLTLGHDIPGGCSGGVVKFKNSKNIKLENLKLYGSGTIGIELNNCQQVEVNHCDVYECTYHLLNIIKSEQISFKNTSFRDTGQFEMLNFEKTSNIIFEKCNFSNNFSNAHLDYDFIDLKGNVDNLQFKKCLFENNNFHRFVNRLGIVKLQKCKFKNNAFSKP